MQSEPAREEAQPASSLPLKAASALSRLGGALSAFLILVVLAITVVSVFNRYALNAPIMGVDEGTGFLVVAIVMLGAAEALRRGDHIRIDILFDRTGPRLRWWLELWSFAGVLCFSALLLVAAWRTVQFSQAFGAYSTGYLSVPMWIPQSTLVIGSALLGVAALAALLELIGRRRP